MKNVAVTFSVPKSINEWPVTKTLSNQSKGMETFLFNLRDETKIYNEQSSSKSQIQCVPLECLPAVAACRSVSFSKYVKSLSKLLFLCCFLFFLIFPPTPALLTEYVFQFMPPVKIQFQNIIRDCFFWLKAAKKSALRNALKKV